MRKGSTRYVYRVGRYAVKIPSLYSWEAFIHGLLANMQEHRFSQTKDSRLCPVVFYIRGGFMCVMPWVDELLEQRMPKDKYTNFVAADVYGLVVPAENKADSFGYLNGRLVAVDYGN